MNGIFGPYMIYERKFMRENQDFKIDVNAYEKNYA